MFLLFCCCRARTSGGVNTSGSASIQSHLPTRSELTDYLLTFQIKSEFILVPVYQPDCSSDLQVTSIVGLTGAGGEIYFTL